MIPSTAAMCGHVEIAAYLLNNGSNGTICDNDGSSALALVDDADAEMKKILIGAGLQY